MSNDRNPLAELFDRRASPRVSLLSPSYFSRSDKERTQGWGWVTDIGLNGMELMSHFQLRNGEALVITFAIEKTANPINICGTVVHVSQREGYYFSGILFAKEFDKALVMNAIENLFQKLLKYSKIHGVSPKKEENKDG